MEERRKSHTRASAQHAITPLQDRRAHERLNSLEQIVAKHISEHAKFEKSITDNTELIKQIVRNTLAPVMEDVRGILGKPIIITSGYRCSRLNKLVGGRPNSKHVDGLACDFICPPWSIPEIIAAMQNSAIPFDQCIMEFYNPATGDGWAHVGLGANPRRQVLTVNRMGTFAGI